MKTEKYDLQIYVTNSYAQNTSTNKLLYSDIWALTDMSNNACTSQKQKLEIYDKSNRVKR